MFEKVSEFLLHTTLINYSLKVLISLALNANFAGKSKDTAKSHCYLPILEIFDIQKVEFEVYWGGDLGGCFSRLNGDPGRHPRSPLKVPH